ncbi:MAG: DUF3025 domain-containing protein [Rhizobacter sp.]
MLDEAFAFLANEVTPPWFADWAATGRRLATLRQPTDTVAEVLNRALAPDVRLSAGPLTFVPQAALPEGEAYEAFIARTACVPTREHPHDLLNGMVWCRFPELKRHLNERQAEEIRRHGIGPRRGAVRDALTLLDENGAFLQAPGRLAEALQARAWRRLFVDLRPAWGEARLVLVGHALMEKLMLSPHKSITAHVWLLPEGFEPERALVNALTPEYLASRAHLPLPLAGVPGWWPGNDSPSFYDDVAVFRPLRR